MNYLIRMSEWTAFIHKGKLLFSMILLALQGKNLVTGAIVTEIVASRF